MYVYMYLHMYIPYVTIYLHFLGTQQTEYKVLIQHYAVLIESLKDQGIDLYRCISSTKHKWIVEYLESKEFNKDHSSVELLLAIIAMELHCGRTSSFYEMLNIMKNIKQNFQALASEIQRNVKTFNPNKFFGM